MPGKRQNSLEQRIRSRIQRSADAVFVRADFDDLAAETGYDQIGRALRKLVEGGELLKAGYGLYVRSEKSPFNGEIIPNVDITEMTRQAMKKLGVSIEPTLMETRYNSDLSTQIPTGRVIRVNKPITRTLQYKNVVIGYEYA